jgi:hypothetical protein
VLTQCNECCNTVQTWSIITLGTFTQCGQTPRNQHHRDMAELLIVSHLDISTVGRHLRNRHLTRTTQGLCTPEYRWRHRCQESDHMFE